jgi:hypothetical protein
MYECFAIKTLLIICCEFIGINNLKKSVVFLIYFNHSPLLNSCISTGIAHYFVHVHSFLNLRSYQSVHRQKIVRYRKPLKLNENCVPLGYYAACSGNTLPTFRDNLSVPFSMVKTTSRVITQKSAVLIYLAPEA